VPLLRIVGDNGQARQLEQALRELGGAGAKRELNQLLGAAAQTRVGLEFEQGVDPYGRAWAPAGRGGQTLRDTGRLANSFNFKAAGDNFRLTTAVKYAGVHQYGATIKATGARKVTTYREDANDNTIKRTRKVGSNYLIFKLPNGHWVKTKQVIIPQRQMVPENDLGPVWLADFDDEVAAFMETLFGI